MSIGIYCLTFDQTDKVYIGKSVNLISRKYSHEWQLKHGKSSKKLNEAYIKYGMPTFNILQECTEEELYNLERQYICEFDSIENGFNTSAGGDAGNVSSGEYNSRAIFTNDKYLEILELLVNTTFSRYKIANLTNSTVSIVSHISSGEGHKWLEQAAPDLYAKLMHIKTVGRVKRTNNAKRPFNKLKSPDGAVYDMLQFNLEEFCSNNSLTSSKISAVLNGHLKKHKDWVAII